MCFDADAAVFFATSAFTFATTIYDAAASDVSSAGMLEF